MKQLSSDQIRRMFLDYFKENGHAIEPGASLVPHDDPTLLWINAGVAALKKYFDGTEKPKNHRIVNAQKAIRTNDIENVGKTARHHTFFEMLGNFSIGDYFKKEAIPFAWHFLTDEKWIGFDPSKLYITVYVDDQEAYDIWTQVCGVDPSHICRSKENFWEIGNGPCGPDTEIYYDRGEKYDPQHIGEKLFFEELENDRYIEVWNVVFSQYNSEEGVDRKDYKELPQKNIDTGMGLERLVCLVQQGETNFDTDLFLPVIHATEEFTTKKYGGENKMAYRVIADHIRTVTFALADGALFSNEGRGYILRRVLRRAVRYGKKLDIKGAYMYKLVPLVAKNMQDYYPYLMEKVEYIQKLVKAEEERFEVTLNEGEKILQNVLNECSNQQLAGEVVFKLYDTYGFPVELTKEIALERGISIDQAGFDSEMAKQKQRARDARSDDQSMNSQAIDLMNFTEPSEFVGYTCYENKAKVIGLFINGVKTNEITDQGEVIFDKTCFYSESGGQIYDTGVISNASTKALVEKVSKAPLKQHLHHVVVKQGKISLNDEFDLQINVHDRQLIKANHSSLHLLQAALRKVVGDHVHQAGSYVCKEYGRFDFTNFEKVSDEQLKEIELIVNEQISANAPVCTTIMSLDEAKETGAMALFDEKYEDQVRVVAMGDFSKELCGGTHVSNTSEIGIFKIISEESIGSGIRRITSKTNFMAYMECVREKNMLEQLACSLKINSIDAVNDKVNNVLLENSQLHKTINELNGKLNASASQQMMNDIITKGDIKILISATEANNDLKALAGQLLAKIKEGVVLLYCNGTDKQNFVCACSNKANEQGYKANEIIKQVSAVCGGNGGGKADVAAGAGKDSSKLAQAIQTAKNILGVN